MDRAALSPLLRSFERHLRAENRSEHTIASYLESLRQAEAFLANRGSSLLDARREDLEAFLGDLPAELRKQAAVWLNECGHLGTIRVPRQPVEG